MATAAQHHQLGVHAQSHSQQDSHSDPLSRPLTHLSSRKRRPLQSPSEKGCLQKPTLQLDVLRMGSAQALLVQQSVSVHVGFVASSSCTALKPVSLASEMMS